MHVMLAAGIEGIFLIVVFTLVGTIASWLSENKKKKEAAERRARGEGPPPPNKTSEDVDLESVLRQLFGQQEPPPAPVAPPPVVAPPPPIVRRVPVPPARDEVREAPFQIRDSLARKIAEIEARESASRAPDEAAIRIAALKAAEVRPPQAVFLPGRARKARQRAMPAEMWSRKGARRAFVASLVFGPPKGLEG